MVRSVRARYGAFSRSCGAMRPVGLKTAHNGRIGFVSRFGSCCSGYFVSQSDSGGITMNIFSYRKHLRFLTHAQRRRWWDQKKRLTPRVRISGAYVPPSVSREFAYVKVG
ncbi:hypothetical protein Bxe_A0883 [Paraburkholderia xenovorans LB400]|uniref:Uncharacterized protein n=5 Tax=Paraburkholderia TaxID=1822464 RepID=Q13V27_PARXL|nr:hypothetical protein Bxe_A0883 [Paraburkholderia xenovorans LB400]